LEKKRLLLARKDSQGTERSRDGKAEAAKLARCLVAVRGSGAGMGV